MRPELEIIEKIEQYLKGNLSDADKLSFEKEIAGNSSLKEEVKLQQEIMNGIERSILTQKIKAAKRKFTIRRNFTRWGLSGLGIVILSVATFFYYNSKTYHLTYDGKSLPEYNELGEKQWVDADKNISAQTFLINASKDTVIETKGGIVIAIPGKSFLKDGKFVDGKIEFVVKEALDPATMIMSGLSTKSGNDLLESGGMFFIDARKDGKLLSIDSSKGIYAEIPTNDVKPGMQLFNGKRMDNGTIDWSNPKPLLHDLVSVDIQSLNFYPPYYLDSLQRWGYDISNKKFTDSLYYSFAWMFAAKDVSRVDTPYPPQNEIGRADSNINYKPDTIAKKNTMQDGRTLFMLKCASCHNIFKTATGPQLGGVLYNDYYKGDIKKMAEWVQNVYSKVNNDPYYKDLKNKFGSVMIQYSDLSEKDVASIFDYINKTYASGFDDYYNNPCGINPAKIKAIWNEKFQSTILATREFEERLRMIHLLGRADILDLYVNNLDKSLSFIDSLADLGMPHWEDSRRPFHLFALRHDGKVKNESKQFQLLKNYYQNKTKAFTEAIAKTEREYWTKQNELDNEAQQKKYEHEADSANRVSENFREEFALNLKEAYKQLGYDTSIKLRSNTSVYKVQITTTGWCNVDRYVYDATASRTTFNYTDTQTNKKAVIKYLPVSIQVDQWNQYDNLYVYLLPDKLNSFMRLDGSNGKYSEKLDELMKYNLICIGYKGDETYFFSQNNIQSKDYTDIRLTGIEKNELNKQINSIAGESQKTAIINENTFFQFEAVDRRRQAHNLTLLELRNRIIQFIFPCYPESPATALVSEK